MVGSRAVRDKHPGATMGGVVVGRGPADRPRPYRIEVVRLPSFESTRETRWSRVRAKGDGGSIWPGTSWDPELALGDTIAFIPDKLTPDGVLGGSWGLLGRREGRWIHQGDAVP